MGRWIAVLAMVSVVACGGSSKGNEDAPPAGPTCGDGVVEGAELCDLGAQNGTMGASCSASCAYACVDAAADCGQAPACQVASCSGDHTCAFAADATQNGMSCGTDKVCLSGQCISITCGDGMVGQGEQCDFGVDNGPDSGCELGCTFSCALGSMTCDDNNPCNGAETCGAVTTPGMGQKCFAGTPQSNGTGCGTGQICVNETCTAAACGDSFTTAPEECDDANQISSDGCEGTCRYSCLSTDSSRNCTPADSCAGQGTCNDSTHRCSAGTPLGNNTACGTGGYCQTGVCSQPMCGDGNRTPNEECDNGLLNGAAGNGCRSDCSWVCDDNPATQCGTAAACRAWSCTTAHTCQSNADLGQNGMACGTGLVCTNGSCASPSAVCGNGMTETGEQCDFGGGNGPNTGCETSCTFSCSTSPNSCDDGDPCNGSETCGAVTVPGAGQKCFVGTPLGNGSTCGTGRLCLSQVCVLSTCGDGFLDVGRGETCEPPNTATCDDVCHTIVCGDGVRKGTEQCDDGNTGRLDGCDQTCKFEQTHRFNSLAVQYGTATYCPKNALGGAIVGSTPRQQLADAVTLGISDGSITVIMHALGLDDLSGTSDPALNIAILGGTPVAGPNYNGASDLDWWYTTDPTTIDANRTPLTLVPSTIVAKALNGGPSSFAITVSFVGVAVTMDMFGAIFRATLGAATTPLTSAGSPPGHLAAENLDPLLTSFGTSTAGELCGNTTAASLANVIAPSVLLGSGTCSQNYSTSNTLLDVFIGGCTFLIFPQIRPTQPDVGRTPGDVYRFTANAQRVVTGCTKNALPAQLSDCLQNAAFSTYYKFTTDRVIAK